MISYANMKLKVKNNVKTFKALSKTFLIFSIVFLLFNKYKIINNKVSIKRFYHKNRLMPITNNEYYII